jgi:hypothetical protein
MRGAEDLVMAYRMAADYNVQGGHFGAPGLHGCAGVAGGCGCGGSCGMGLFDSGMDFTTWGAPEWAIVAIGLYSVLSLLGDTKRGYERTKRIGKAVRKAA